MLFYRERKGEKLFDVLLDAGSSFGVEIFVFKHPWGVEPKVDANVAILFVGCGVEVWSKASDANS